MNTILVIFPYRIHNVWVFDDPKAGLIREPFVAETNRFIDELSAQVPAAEKGFALSFSACAFPTCALTLARGEPDCGGYWYLHPDGRAGWLCAALFKYFDTAPLYIFAAAAPI